MKHDNALIHKNVITFSAGNHNWILQLVSLYFHKRESEHVLSFSLRHKR